MEGEGGLKVKFQVLQVEPFRHKSVSLHFDKI